MSSVNSYAISNANVCKVTLYTEERGGGNSQIIINDEGSLDINENSAKTSGACCWKIYRYDRFPILTRNDIFYKMDGFVLLKLRHLYYIFILLDKQVIVDKVECYSVTNNFQRQHIGAGSQETLKV